MKVQKRLIHLKAVKSLPQEHVRHITKQPKLDGGKAPGEHASEAEVQSPLAKLLS